ncbi:MAG: CrcB family protein [Oligoflexia bacterium]|nr:CrcB family protein [Oligoflexia bacterium]
MNLQNFLLVGFGGAMGATLRFVSEWSIKKYLALPLPIMLINTFGCFLAGLTYYLFEKHSYSNLFYSFLFIGLLGGFTTFSSYTLDILKTLQQGQSLLTVFYYTLMSPILGLIACFSGYYFTKLIIK